MIDRKQSLLDQSHPMIDLQKWQKIVNLMSELFGAPCGSIVQHLDDIFTVVCTADNPDNFQPPCASFPWEIKSYCRRIIESERELYVKQADTDSEWRDKLPAKEHHIYSYFGYPVTWPDGEIFGTICVSEKEGSNYNETLKKVLEQFRDLINADLALASQYDEVKTLSLTDEMTGSYNRRGLLTLGEHKIGLAERFECGLGIIFLDIDNLKTVNDSAGHIFGDLAITLLADTLRAASRSTDIIARIGGDEFVLLFLLNDENFVSNLKTRISQQYRAVLKKHSQLSAVDVSIGSQYYSHNQMPALEKMLEQADISMYENKKLKK